MTHGLSAEGAKAGVKKSRRLTILPFCVIQFFQIVLVFKSFYWTKSYISSAVLHLHLRCSCFIHRCSYCIFWFWNIFSCFAIAFYMCQIFCPLYIDVVCIVNVSVWEPKVVLALAGPRYFQLGPAGPPPTHHSA